MVRGDYRLSKRQIDFITYWQVVGIILCGAWCAFFAKIYNNFTFWFVYQCCCEEHTCDHKFPFCRLGWCETMYNDALQDQISDLERNLYYLLLHNNINYNNNNGNYDENIHL